MMPFLNNTPLFLHMDKTAVVHSHVIKQQMYPIVMMFVIGVVFLDWINKRLKKFVSFIKEEEYVTNHLLNDISDVDRQRQPTPINAI